MDCCLCDISSTGLLWMCVWDGMCWTRNIAKAEVHSMGGKGEVYMSLCVCLLDFLEQITSAICS